jgi:hypothetical protein
VRGSVPARKNSGWRRGQPSSASAPVAGSISATRTDGGRGKEPATRPPVTSFRKRCQSGSAIEAAACRISRGSSYPTHTTATRSGVKPANHRSFDSSLVPVFPAIGPMKPAARTARAVPRSTTPSSSDTVRKAVPASSARADSTRRRSIVSPPSSATSSNRSTSGRTPPLAKVA